MGFRGFSVFRVFSQGLGSGLGAYGFRGLGVRGLGPKYVRALKIPWGPAPEP